MSKYISLALIVIAGTAAVFSYAYIPKTDLAYQRGLESNDLMAAEEKTASVVEESIPEIVDTREVINHVPLPPQVKAIYMTSCVAGTPDFRARVVKLIEETEINSVVIDIKDYSGTISFNPEHEEWLPAWQNARCGARDMKDFISYLHDLDIFVIGRVTVFQDPFYSMRFPHLAVKKLDGNTVWKDHKGLSFIDVAASEYWDYIIKLSVDSYNIGFDELNFDYVRYPSDGNMQDISFPHTAGSEWPNDKQANLEAFFKYLNEDLDKEEKFSAYRHENTGRSSSTPWTSVDLFGMTTTNHDDLSIGQVIERAAPYFDFIAPMVYPSHYPKNFLGLGNPNLYPYKIVNYAMSSGVERMTATTTSVKGFLHERVGTSTPAVYRKPVYTADKLRTWIQDFDYGGDYGPKEVRDQIQASYDAGVMSFMIWAPSNIYTKSALLGPSVFEVALSGRSATSSVVNDEN
ncbi:MAG: putative glycoside hydrolase [Candidatus Paceibacterota bacterium]